MTEDRPLYTADDVRKAAWAKGASASTTRAGKPLTVRTSTCLVGGVTVTGTVEEWDGTRTVTYHVHGQNVDSLEAVAALLSGRWIAGDDSAALDD